MNENLLAVLNIMSQIAGSPSYTDKMRDEAEKTILSLLTLVEKEKEISLTQLNQFSAKQAGIIS